MEELRHTRDTKLSVQCSELDDDLQDFQGKPDDG
jgi:hypothetical protein